MKFMDGDDIRVVADVIVKPEVLGSVVPSYNAQLMELALWHHCESV